MWRNQDSKNQLIEENSSGINNKDSLELNKAYTWPNGDTYVGQWENSNMHGEGKYIWSNGKEYYGQWKDGKMYGKGTMIWPSRSKFVGEWKDGKMDGHGSYTWPNKITYKGGWEDGKIQGHGVWYWPSSKDALFNGMEIDSKYARIIYSLIADGYTTNEKVREINLLRYLNEKGFYDFKKRMTLLGEINNLFNPNISEQVEDGDKENNFKIEKPAANLAEEETRTIIELEKLLKQKQKIATFEEVRSFKPKLKSLRSLLDAADNVIKIKGSYIHRDNIYGFDDFAETILASLKSLFSANNGHTTAFMLFSSIQSRLEDFFFDNGFESAIEVYELARHLFEKENYMGNSFIFYRSFHIWENEPDYPKSYAGLFIKWAKESNGIISREHCHEKLKSIGARSIDSLFSNTYYKIRHLLWQYEPYKYVLAECFETSDHWKAACYERLKSLFSNVAFVPLRDIADHWFETLPTIPIGVKWTPLLLQEVITYVDVGFRSIPAGSGQSFDAIHAVIVPVHSNIETFGDVVWRVADEDYSTPTSVIATEDLRQSLINRNILFGNERLWSLHKAIGDDLRFRWIDNHSKVKVFSM